MRGASFRLRRRANQSVWLVVCLITVMLGEASLRSAVESNQGTNGQRAFLDAKALLSGWESTYGAIRSISVAYSRHLVAREQVNGKGGLRLKEWLHEDVVQEGARYRLRSSDSPAGFSDEGSIIANAFDGQVAMSYNGRTRKGVVSSDREDLGPGIGFRKYMYLQTYPTELHAADGRVARMPAAYAGKLQFLGLFENVTAEGSPIFPAVTVRPQMEQVAGQWCHVLEVSPSEKEQIPTARVWLAQDLGMALLKYQVILPSGFTSRMVVQEAGAVETKIGKMWYPRKAELSYFTPGIGTSTYILDVQRFEPNPHVEGDKFKLEFPLGTRVYDRNVGVVYTVSSDPAQADMEVLGGGQGSTITRDSTTTPKQARATITGKPPETSIGAYKRVRLYVIAVVAGVVAVFVSFLLYVTYTRKRSLKGAGNAKN